MAAVGTCVSFVDQYRNVNITLTGLVLGTGNTSQLFRSIGFVIGSWELSGSLTSPSVTLTGSNDGINFFSIGSAVTAAGIYSLANPTNLVPVYYQFNLGASGSGTATIVATLMSTFG